MFAGAGNPDGVVECTATEFRLGVRSAGSARGARMAIQCGTWVPATGAGCTVDGWYGAFGKLGRGGSPGRAVWSGSLGLRLTPKRREWEWVVTGGVVGCLEGVERILTSFARIFEEYSLCRIILARILAE